MSKRSSVCAFVFSNIHLRTFPAVMVLRSLQRTEDSTVRERAAIEDVIRRNRGEHEFHQSVREVAETLGSVLRKHPEYAEHKIIERICEPERQIIFRVPWQGQPGNYVIGANIVGFRRVAEAMLAFGVI